jgi:hypothetical protein
VRRRHHAGPASRRQPSRHIRGDGGEPSEAGLRIPLGDAPVPALPCPPGISAVKLTVAEAARLTRMARQYAAGHITSARLAFHLRWSRWRRRHQARARRHHYAAASPPQPPDVGGRKKVTRCNRKPEPTTSQFVT